MSTPAVPTTSLELDDYRVELDAYEGPLDLLLYLVKRHEIDLNDIPIADLTQQYLEYLKALQSIDLERAGDFLVMAATLLEIKSQMLAPYVAQEDQGAEEADRPAVAETDPRYELVQQLLAYKRFKDAAMDLEDQLTQWRNRYAAQPGAASDQVETPDAVEFDLDDVDVHHLCEAFTRLLESIGNPAVHSVAYDDTPISLHEEDILDRLQRDGAALSAPDGATGSGLTLAQIFQGRPTRSEMIGLFLALLELIRQRRVRVFEQTAGIDDRIGQHIQIMLRNPQDAQEQEADDSPDRWRNPQTGEIDYDWPSEEIRQRLEQRKQRRSQRLAQIRRGEKIEEDADDVIDVDE